MTPVADDAALDDQQLLEELDPGGMARAVAESGAQIRRAMSEVDRGALDAIARAERPRAVVVAGMGGSGISGDVLGAVVDGGSPMLTVRSYDLPGWIGTHDMVIAVSCSGQTAETLSVAAAAAQRGAQLVGIGASDSPLAGLVADAAGTYLSVDARGLLPRAALWCLATPLLLAGTALGIADVSEADLLAAADIADQVSEQCGPVAPMTDNPAKAIGAALAESIPVIWGSTPLAGVAAYRAVCQLNENAKLPGTWGMLPEVDHNQVVAFDGPYAQGDGDDRLFHDPVESGPVAPRLRGLLLRDSVEDVREATRADATLHLAAHREVPFDSIEATGEHPVSRLAALLTTVDWISVYAALALHIDPTPIVAIEELKRHLA